MDVIVKRKEIMEWVSNLGEETLEILDQIKSSQKSDWWNELSDHEKQMVAKGQDDINQGKTVRYSSVMKKYGL